MNGSSFVEQSEGDKEDLLLRSRVFYFNRWVQISYAVPVIANQSFSVAGSLLDVDDVRKHIQNANLTSHPIVLPSEPSTAAPNAAEESRVLSFAELKELIEQGKTDQIPNNRVIPNELSVCTRFEILVLFLTSKPRIERTTKRIRLICEEETLGEVKAAV